MWGVKTRNVKIIDIKIFYFSNIFKRSLNVHQFHLCQVPIHNTMYQLPTVKVELCFKQWRSVGNLND